jgi:hypothetical protein
MMCFEASKPANALQTRPKPCALIGHQAVEAANRRLYLVLDIYDVLGQCIQNLAPHG